MKQQISSEQLQELTEEQKERLREWWKPQMWHQMIDNKGLYYLGFQTKDIEADKENLLPLLSIGQMIDFIDGEREELWSFREKMLTPYKEDAYWRVRGIDNLEFSGNSLCDALWEAVKYLLNDKK